MKATKLIGLIFFMSGIVIVASGLIISKKSIEHLPNVTGSSPSEILISAIMLGGICMILAMVLVFISKQ